MARINLSAWREILARIFDGFETQYNVSPEWLINPKTNRRLKLDLLYPEIGLAVRFEGLKSHQQRRLLSLEEELQEKQRTAAREEMCRQHGISLAILNLSIVELGEVFASLEGAMSRATRLLAKDASRPPEEKATLLERMRNARATANQMRRGVKNDRDLNNYSALWHDRQFQQTAAEAAARVAPLLALREGMRIEHTHFGEGLVEVVKPSGDDLQVTIDFIEAGRRTFLVSLLADKLSIINE